MASRSWQEKRLADFWQYCFSLTLQMHFIVRSGIYFQKSLYGSGKGFFGGFQSDRKVQNSHIDSVLFSLQRKEKMI